VISRWPFYASVAVLGCACIVYFIAASVEWGDRGAMVGTDSAEAAEQARFAIELGGIGALSLLVSGAYVFRRSGWWLVVGVQVVIFVLALMGGVLTDLGWFYVSSLPVLTVFLLLTFRKPPAVLKQLIERNLTAV
jgi:hypothetical protein